MKNKLKRNIMVTMNDIIAFIERAMRENLLANSFIIECSDSSFNEYSINIYFNNKEFFRFNVINSDINKVTITTKCFNGVDIEISEMDIALFKVEALKVQEYSKNKVLEAFNNFFERDLSKPTTINDLDNEDD